MSALPTVLAAALGIYIADMPHVPPGGATTSTTSTTVAGSSTTSTSTSSTTSTTVSGDPLPDWTGESALVGLWPCESETSGVTPDASAAGNPLTLSATASVSTAQAWSGSASCLQTDLSDPITCETADGCTESDFWFTASFTVGCASRVIEVTTGSTPWWYMTTDTTNGSTGAGWSLGHRSGDYMFNIDRTTAAANSQLNSTSGPSLSLNTWKHHVGRYTAGSRLQEQFFDGSVGSDTKTLPSGEPVDHDIFAMGASSRTSHSYVDECFAWNGSTTNLTDADICRIAVCDWGDGSSAGCTCDTGTPASYASAPRHTSFGGSMTCTLPDCDKAHPGTTTSTTTTTSSTTSTTI